MSRELEKARELVRMLEEKEKENKVLLSELNLGETFMIGEREFIVLEHPLAVPGRNGEICCGETVVISKDLLAQNEKFGDTRNYKESDIKELIESKIQPMIESVVGADNLIEHEVDLTSVDMQNEFGTYKCKVRPITFDEARKYNDLLVNEELPDWYWTLTSWSTEKRGWKYKMTVVAPSGSIIYSYSNSIGVRPVCILKSNIFVSKKEQKND